MAFKDPQRPACEEVGPLLSELRAGELAPAVARRLTGHLQSCAACRDEAEALDAVEDALRIERLPDPGPDFADRVMDELPARARRRARWLRPASVAVMGLAAAAAAALMFGLPIDPPEELQDSVMVRDVVPESWVGLLDGMGVEALEAVVEDLQAEVEQAETKAFKGGLSESAAWAEVAELAAEDPGQLLDVATSSDQGGE